MEMIEAFDLQRKKKWAWGVAHWIEGHFLRVQREPIMDKGAFGAGTVMETMQGSNVSENDLIFH